MGIIWAMIAIAVVLCLCLGANVWLGALGAVTLFFIIAGTC